MRNILNILCVCVLSATASAQTYHPIPESNARWLYKAIMPPYDGSTNYDFVLYTDGDTLINSISYVKINMAWDYYFGALRNDVFNKKVYCVPTDSGEEYLLYDFGASVGDTLFNVFNNTLQYSFEWNLYDYKVLAIDSFLMEGEYYKIITVSKLPGDQGLLKWFEGFGSEHGLFGANNTGSVSGLTYWDCAVFNTVNYHNFNSYIQSSTNPCYTNLSVEETNISFSIGPNPFSSTLQLKIEELGMVEIVLCDLMGKVQYREQYFQTEINIPTKHLANGIYLLSIYKDEKLVGRERVMKGE